MNTFRLEVDSWVQGECDPSRYKALVLLTFQVNCPGCFMHALPALATLAKDAELRAAGVGVAAVATAFEDFEYNTKDNLAALLSHGTVVGETAKFYSRRDGAGTAADESKAAGAGSGAGSGTGGVKCPLDLSGVPFAWDKVGPITEASCNTAVEAQLAQVMEATGGVLPPGMSKYMLIERIKQFVKARGYSAATFDANRMQGTPTWAVVLVDATGAGAAAATGTGGDEAGAGTAPTSAKTVLRVARPSDVFIGHATADKLKALVLQRVKAAATK